MRGQDEKNGMAQQQSIAVGTSYIDTQLPEQGEVVVMEWDGQNPFAKVWSARCGLPYRARVEFLELPGAA